MKQKMTMTHFAGSVFGDRRRWVVLLTAGCGLALMALGGCASRSGGGEPRPIGAVTTTPSYAIRGVVQDKDAQPIEGASIRTEPSIGPAATDAEGVFTFFVNGMTGGPIDAGTYMVTVSKAGYQPAKSEMVFDGSPLEVRIQLAKVGEPPLPAVPPSTDSASPGNSGSGVVREGQ